MNLEVIHFFKAPTNMILTCPIWNLQVEREKSPANTKRRTNLFSLIHHLLYIPNVRLPLMKKVYIIFHGPNCIMSPNLYFRWHNWSLALLWMQEIMIDEITFKISIILFKNHSFLNFRNYDAKISQDTFSLFPPSKAKKARLN